MKRYCAQMLRPLCVVALLFSLFVVGWSVPGFAQATDVASDDSQQDKNKWDVMNPPGNWETVSFSTTSGTWMSLDVSPDGEEIVFDLLGDIYRLPIAGGEAEALTTGIAWDMQPTYSPDGESIAFTSDREGGDNLWVMDANGTGARALSSEKYRLLNSPSWTPDGQYVAGRKHFTSKRSLGAGEIWLYHVLGGEGVQMTKRPDDQKDVGEPAFSPDGRYLYFSQDVSPGNTFQYSKDPNGVIYAINRLDRETGDLERYLSRPGGSIRPTPSPDGKYLAFIRRVQYATTLFLRDLASGVEWPLYDGLDRDMQETWATHGVYPTMAWTPDNASIVFWAAGEIRRIDIGTQVVSTIPFEVDVKRQVAKTVRYSVEVAPDRFTTKMLRWVQVSPDGEKVVFQALGYLYVRDLDGGRAERLTRQTEHFEFHPTWSRDSKRLAYTTWNDEELGEVRVAGIGGRRSRALTSVPGHYVEPAFSPDGETVVYRKVGGGGLRTGAWSNDRGVYRVPVSGGDSELVRKKGIFPHFGAEDDRVFLLDIEGGAEKDSRRLISIALDGNDERSHFNSENATNFRVSPDGKWVALQEFFHAFILPFARSGRQIDIGPKSKSLPIRKVSENAGNYLHWTGNSASLHWSLGPTLFTQAVDAVFRLEEEEEEDTEKGPAIQAEEMDLGFEVVADIPEGSLALVGARIITMRDREVIEDGTVIIEGNRISAIGTRDDVDIPQGALVMDVSGQTIMPGLVDVHAHGGMGSQGITPERNWQQYANLAFGVTTIHDPSNDTATIFAASEMARTGIVTMPRVFSTGTILYGAAGAQRAEVDSLEDARTHLVRMQAAGAFSVKSYNQPRRDQRQQVLAVARELKMMVVPEGGSLYQHDMTMIVDGHTGIEHSIPVARLYRDALELWSATGTGYTPTLVVAYGGSWGENYWYQESNVWEHERLMTFVPRDVVEPRSRRRVMIPDEELNHIDIARGAKGLLDAGGRVQIGAHGQLAGLAAHWEVWMLAQGGMTPYEALRAASLDGARYLGLDADIGSLEVGKLADLLVLDRNPLDNIRDSESIRYTVRNGRIYDAATMDEVGNHPKKRGSFFWEIDYRP